MKVILLASGLIGWLVAETKEFYQQGGIENVLAFKLLKITVILIILLVLVILTALNPQIKKGDQNVEDENPETITRKIAVFRGRDKNKRSTSPLMRVYSE